MLQFVNPIWLAAGIGIIIPVIIHLWNARKGKVLRIGSTLLISDATKQNTSSLRLSQWLLLLIRCLLIFFLAMLLAGPEWHANKQRTGKGWVLIDKKDYRVIYRLFKSPIDSLLKNGYELHDADESLEKINLSDSSQFIDGGTASPKKTFSYWSVLVKADQLLPAGYPVYFFSNDKLGDATGNKFSRRPNVSIDLRWQMAQTDKLLAAIPAFTRQLSTGGYQLASLQPANNGSHFIKTVSLNPPVNSMQPDTSTLVITIYHNKFSEDLRYLQAAIRAISDFGNYKLSLKTVEEINNIPKTGNWLFWLSHQTLPENLSYENLFVYQPGTSVTTKSWLTTNDGAVPPDAFTIYQRIITSQKKSNNIKNLSLAENLSVVENLSVIWKDGFGNALLTLENINSGYFNNKKIYRLYTRFHPAWSDLSWNPGFPKLIFPLIIKDRFIENNVAYDQNRTEAADVIPTVVMQTYKENKSALEVIELDKLFWLLTFLLFAAERILSINSRTRKIV